MHFKNGTYNSIPLNCSDIPQSLLNIEDKSRVNPLSWNGQFSPQLLEVLIKNYAQRNYVLFDPFLGSGTLLLESGNLGFSAFGTEINPAAVYLSRVYNLINIPYEQRKKYLNFLSQLINKEFLKHLSFFDKQEFDVQSAEEKIKRILSSFNDYYNQIIIEAFVVLLDLFKARFTLETIFKKWNKLVDIINKLPYSTKEIGVFHADARKTPIPNSYIDLVITSPPYINVHNYHQQYRRSVEFLNWNLLEIAKSEIGSNRKNRVNRFLTIIQYCIEMFQVFEELKRICKPNSRLIFIIGKESTIRKIKFYNGEIVSEIAQQVNGFTLFLRQQRMFTNRYGQKIYEDILHFQTPTILSISSIESARRIAIEILESTLSSAPDYVRFDIENAIKNANKVNPSPIFHCSNNKVAMKI